MSNLLRIPPSVTMTAEQALSSALVDAEEGDLTDVLAPIGASAWGEAYQAGWGEGTAAYYEAIKARNQT